MTLHVEPRECLTPNAVARFQCIGGACEDTCCKGWAIFVDEPSYKKLKSAMHGRDERAEFASAVKRTRGPEGKDKFALLVMKDDQACSFLTKERTCSVHARYGAATLSDTCASYPRDLGFISDRLEQTAKLSCPEMARLFLLESDSMGLVDFDHRTLPRAVLSRVVVNPDSYAAPIDAVRGAFLQTLTTEGISVAARLAWLGMVAEATSGWFRRGQPCDGARLLAVLAEGENRSTLLHLDRDFGSIEVPEVVGGFIAAQALRVRRKWRLQRLDELLSEIVDAAKLENDGSLLERFKTRRAAMPKIVHQTLDQIVTRYAMHFVFSQWYVDYPDLRAWVRSLYLRVALLRFMTLCHPRLGPTSTQRDVEEVAVMVAQRFARAFEHNAALLVEMERELETSAPRIELMLTLLKL